MPFYRLPVALAALSIIPMWAADRGPLRVPSQASPRAVLRSDSNLVLINATVLDGNGRIITGLDGSRFRVLDDRQEQSLESVTLEESPVSVVVVFDISGSLRRDIAELRSALNVFLDSLRTDDDVSLITFNDKPIIAVPFTHDLTAVREAAGRAQAGGGTALLDAVVLGLAHSNTERKRSEARRRVLVVFTDGGDRNSRYTWRDVRELAREADVRIYPFVLWSAAQDFAVEQASLKDLADDTGGWLLAVSRSRRLPEEVAKLEIHTQYVLGFAPRSQQRDGRFRRVKVELHDTPQHWKVFWKHGYFSPPE